MRPSSPSVDSAGGTRTGAVVQGWERRVPPTELIILLATAPRERSRRNYAFLTRMLPIRCAAVSQASIASSSAS